MTPSDTIETQSAGERSRDRLMEAALDLFGQSGFNGVSVREIASDAKINVAQINYHFGGKEGLFLAVAERISSAMTARLAPVVAEARASLERGMDPAAAIERLQAMMCVVADILVPGSVETARWARFITRFQQDDNVPENALATPELHDVVANLVTRASNGQVTGQEARILSLMILGQILIFRASRRTALQTIGTTDFGPAEVEAIKARLKRQIKSTFEEYA